MEMYVGGRGVEGRVERERERESASGRGPGDRENKKLSPFPKMLFVSPPRAEEEAGGRGH